MAETTSQPLEGKPTMGAGAPVGAGADTAPKARKAPSADQLRNLIALIEAENVPHLRAGLIEQLAAHKGKVTYTNGTHVVRLAKIVATATMGEEHALKNWCARARRVLLEMEG